MLHDNQKKLEMAPIGIHGSSDTVTKVERYRWAKPDKPGELEWIEKTHIQIDHRYQRDGKEDAIKLIASKFNWPAFGVITVARRGDRLFAVDGQHRLLATMLRADISVVPCVVFESNGMVGEAQTFLDAQILRKPVKAVEKFKAQIVTRNPTALRVQALLDGTGRSVSSSSYSTSVACVALLMRLMATSPSELERVWPLISRLCDGRPITDRIVSALVYIEQRLPEGVSLVDKRWSQRLLAAGPELLTQKMAQFSATYSQGGPKRWSEGVMFVLNRKLAAPAQLKFRDQAEDDEGRQ